MAPTPRVNAPEGIEERNSSVRRGLPPTAVHLGPSAGEADMRIPEACWPGSLAKW